MIHVGVVDDHPVVRDGIVANLRDAEDLVVAWATGSAAGALAALARDAIDVLVLDLELPDRNGLDLIAELKTQSPSIRIVVFTAYAGEERVAAALERGADSYVLKGTASDELIATVRAAAAGRPRLDPDLAAQLVRGLRARGTERLTPREREILAKIADGLTNREIGQLLGIAERTVKFHVGEILARLGAANRTQAVAVAKVRGLL